jgi:hypothetical protein
MKLNNSICCVLWCNQIPTTREPRKPHLEDLEDRASQAVGLSITVPRLLPPMVHGGSELGVWKATASVWTVQKGKILGDIAGWSEKRHGGCRLGRYRGRDDSFWGCTNSGHDSRRAST